MKHIVLAYLLTFFYIVAYSQEAVDVTDITFRLKPNSEQEFYYGFAEGDQIIFHFQEMDKNEVKEVEVIEYPNNVKFMDYKTSKVENKKINILKTSVYKFRFKNTHLLKGRVCKLKIQRICANEKYKNFNTSIFWVSKYDTTWRTFTKEVVVGYDTTFTEKTRIDVVSEEIIEDMLFDKTERVNSISNPNKNKSSIFFMLPNNLQSKYETREVIAWAYWLGVGQQSEDTWRQNKKLVVGLTSKLASTVLSPLGAYAIGQTAGLLIPKVGDDVSYGIVNEANHNNFRARLQYRGYDFGRGPGGYKKFDSKNLLQGKYYIILTNDNMIQGIDVNIKVSAIIKKKTYKDVTYIDRGITPKYNTNIYKEPIITENIFPITSDFECLNCKVVSPPNK